MGTGKRGHAILAVFGRLADCCGVLWWTWSITVVHLVAQINEARRNVCCFTAFLKIQDSRFKMWRGELSGSAPLKEPGASKTRLKDGTTTNKRALYGSVIFNLFNFFI